MHGCAPPVLREEWDALAQAHPDRLKVVYALDKPPKGWTGPTGYVSKQVLEQNAGADASLAEKVKVFVCGVRPFPSRLIDRTV
jgi:cytochrome-b5 reductase